MKKGCVIGNSHAAAVIEGWARLKPGETRFDLDFFAFPAISPAEIRLENGEMSASSMMSETLIARGVRNRVRLPDYDFLMVVGCGLNLMLSARGLRRHQRGDDGDARADWRERLFRAAPGIFPAPRSLVSEECLQTARDALTEATVAVRLAKQLHGATQVPIIVTPEPLPSSTILKAADKGRFMRKLRDGGEGRYARAALYDSIERALSNLPRAHLVRHPKMAIEDEAFTPAALGVDALRLFNLSSTFDADDYWHANGVYGEALLRSVLDKIGEISDRN